MTNYSVGKSSYGALKGIDQFVTSKATADQFNSLAYEFDTQKAKNGDRLSVNEANRSRPRQKLLYAAYQHYLRYGSPYADLAAYCTDGPPPKFTSTHDEVNWGNALDIGITDINGNYRVPTADEWAWIHSRGAARGIRHTGASFNPREEWHHNGGYAASVAPIVGVRVANSPVTPPPPVTKEDDDMANLIWNKTAAGDPHNGDVWVIDGLRVAKKTATDAEIYNLGRTLGILSPGQNWQTAAIITITGELQTRLRAIASCGGYVDPAGKDLL